MSKKHELILSELKLRSYSKIEANYWGPRYRAKLLRWLQKQGYEQCQFYRIRDEENCYLITLPGADHPYFLELEYRTERSFILKILPLLIAFLLMAGTVALASSHNNLMSSAIVISIPVVAGMLLEYFSGRYKPVTLEVVFKNTLIILGIILFGSIFALREGSICIIMLMPFAFLLSLVGSILMKMICWLFWKVDNKVYALSLLPFVLWNVPVNHSDYYGQTQRSVIVHAPVEDVFHAIQYIGPIQSQEVEKNFIFTMGFPRPLYGMTKQENGEKVRFIQWERGVKFKEVVTDERAPYALSWVYQFAPDSFPKGSMDDHVGVGGKYFNLLKTDYKLDKLDDHTTRLTLMIDYRLSTEYNWYSKLWADYILNQFSDVVMNIHKNRMEKKFGYSEK